MLGVAPIVSETGDRGTEIVVEDLFANVPARLNPEKTQTESTHIVETVQRLALCYPYCICHSRWSTVVDLPVHNLPSVW